MTGALLTDTLLRRAVAVAVRAPSLHNTQPWRFVRAGDRVLVRADPDRWLRHEDPLHREQVLSCGAATHHLVVGLRHEGLDATWQPATGGDPDLVATVTVVGHRPETWEEQHLLAAALSRYTDRSTFGPEHVPTALLHQLSAVAAAAGCSLTQLDARGVTALAILTDLAAERLRDDPALRDEQARWTTDPRHPKEGVPVDATPADVVSAVHLRDFRGRAVGTPTFPDAPGELVVLATPTDDRAAWARAGWALSEVLLTLTGQGLASSPLGQPLELHGLRACLRAAGRVDGYPQLVLRLGYPATFGSPRTARRPVEDVLSST
ncbi:MAG: Acg family FMN-binding oxidoreductase [Mycobacteriales bacterium]